jgi:DNA-binding SARP family transcriptional activator
VCATLWAQGWLEVGEQDVLRIYLTSQVRIEHDEILIGERALPGRQGRVVLALLVAERDRPVTRDELAEELWLDTPPAAWEKAVMAVISKLRAALRRASIGDAALETSFGCYQLHLPADTWVDIEAAADAVHRAETALAAGDPRAAYPWAYVAYHVCRRPFLAGEDGPWVRRKRIQLREVHLRALDCTVECAAANGELAEAIQAAEDALAIEPFRETTYQRLMRVHAAAGNRAEALRAYQRCRAVLAEELGVPPTPETETVYTAIVQS